MQQSMPQRSHAMDEDLVGVLVELLDPLALDVDLTRAPEHIDQPGLVHLPGDDLGSQDEIVEHPGEPPRGHRRFLLVQQEMLGNGDLAHLVDLQWALLAGLRP
jgi:hypothetical protein